MNLRLPSQNGVDTFYISQSSSSSSSSSSPSSSSGPMRPIAVISFPSLLTLSIIAALTIHISTSVSAQTLPLRSLAISNDVSYITDAKNNVFYSNKGAWVQIATPGVSALMVSMYGSSRLAMVGNSSNTLFSRGVPISSSEPWSPDGGSLITRISSNPQGDLWLTTSQNVLFRFDGGQTFTPDGSNGGNVYDVSVRDRVYTIEATPSSAARICSRSFESGITGKVCLTPSFTLQRLAVSDTLIYALTKEGTLYASELPLTTSSVFFDTGFRAPGATFLDVPLDNPYPFVIRLDGTLDTTFCTITVINCFGKVGAPTSPSSTLVPSVGPSSTSKPSSTQTQANGGQDTPAPGPNIGAIVGGIVGGVIAVVVVIVLFVMIRRNRQLEEEKKKLSNYVVASHTGMGESNGDYIAASSSNSGMGSPYMSVNQKAQSLPASGNASPALHLSNIPMTMAATTERTIVSPVMYAPVLPIIDDTKPYSQSPTPAIGSPKGLWGSTPQKDIDPIPFPEEKTDLVAPPRRSVPVVHEDYLDGVIAGADVPPRYRESLYRGNAAGTAGRSAGATATATAEGASGPVVAAVIEGNVATPTSAQGSQQEKLLPDVTSDVTVFQGPDWDKKDPSLFK
ncbi:hypothetical protein HDU97_004775 [Phlyctochytrium planicorne]|nr:hypothetical protein HDU97_004775 [Phlyctochytrium planicorne]